MKKTNLMFKALMVLLFTASQAFSQQLQTQSLEIATASHGGLIASFLRYSPNLNHEHDGEHCLSDALTQDWIEKEGITEAYRMQEAYQNNMVSATASSDDRETFTIPIIFHVIYNTPTENVSSALINDLLDEINADFSADNPDVGDARGEFGFVPADADINFCMATEDETGAPLTEPGVHRVATVETWYDPDTESNKMKGSTFGDTGTEGWDRDRYLNVWICDITNGASFGVAGYAYKPTVFALPPSSIDGIVIDYNIGTDIGAHILTHEIGHFLGLDHTWGGGSGSCSTDDGLDDTPNTAGPSFDFIGTCSDQTTCPGTQTQYENFMDYSNCTVMYTQDQVDLMYLVLENSRSELAGSDACGAPVIIAPVADFTADITTIVEGGSSNFADLSTNVPTSWSWSVSPATGVNFISGTSASSQNPVIQFNNSGFHTVTLTATNSAGSDSEVKTSYIEVIAGGDGTTDCDTIRNYSDAEFAGYTYYSLGASESGYYPSQLTLDGGTLLVDGYAEAFSAPGGAFVQRLRMPILQADDVAGASNITFRVWEDDAGEPGAVLGSEVIAINDLDAGFFNIIEFSSGIAVLGNYWVGMEFDYSAGFDTVVFATTNFDDRLPGTSTTSALISDGIGWLRTSDLFTSEPNCSLILEVLTSNGPAPTAVVSFPVDEVCEGVAVTMNGSGSLNTTDYYWNISDGTDDFFFAESNLTTSFEEGTWTISLTVDGSCTSDQSDEYILTVNSGMDVTPTAVSENCVASDGEVSYVVTGGDGGPYEYSINGGATYQPTNTFTGLSSGIYDYVLKDAANCADSGMVSVDNINLFNPTISDDVTIVEGTATDLEVTGGVTWGWYVGVDLVGSTVSLTVNPATTTTYICNVTDSDGCESTLEVTVTVEEEDGGGVGIGEVSLGNSLSLYPNPSNGDFFIAFDLDQAKDIQIEVVNLLGDQLLIKTYASVLDNTIAFDLGNVAPGIYFVVLKSQEETVTKKVIIKK